MPLNLSKRASHLKGTKSSLLTFEFVRLSETLFHLVMDRNWSLERNLTVFIFVKKSIKITKYQTHVLNFIKFCKLKLISLRYTILTLPNMRMVSFEIGM